MERGEDAVVQQADPEGPVPVLVVDDQESFRAAMRDVFAADDRLRLIGEVESGDGALRAVTQLSPRMVIMDLRMPGMDGIEATRLLKARHPELVVVLVSAEEPDVQLVRSSGATAFVPKHRLCASSLFEVWQGRDG